MILLSYKKLGRKAKDFENFYLERIMSVLLHQLCPIKVMHYTKLGTIMEYVIQFQLFIKFPICFLPKKPQALLRV